MPSETADQLKDRIGRRIGEIRDALGISQADFSERIEMDISNYQRIETGVQNVTVETLLRIADKLGVSVNEFFSAPTRPRPPPGRPPKP